MESGFKRYFAVLIFLGALACYPTPGPDKTAAGVILGTAWGSGAGAIVGNQVNATPEGAAIGAGLGLVNGLLTGVGLDVAEQEELRQQEEIDALKARVSASHRTLMQLKSELDDQASGDL
ncbi:MAG: hypothetical protein IT291_08885 [Deltaproteobacteria bacterium]|nr:hypothetical protein [Deltaproteobacteria bacterium]